MQLRVCFGNEGLKGFPLPHIGETPTLLRPAVPCLNFVNLRELAREFVPEMTGGQTRDKGMERRRQSSRCRVRVFRTMREALEVARDGARTPNGKEQKNGRLTVCA